MKHKVLKPFIDRVSLIGYNEGNTYESTDSERVAFLVEQGYIAGEIAVENLDYIQLKAQAKELGIKGYNKMKQEELLVAIEAAKVAETNGESGTTGEDTQVTTD